MHGDILHVDLPGRSGNRRRDRNPVSSVSDSNPEGSSDTVNTAPPPSRFEVLPRTPIAGPLVPSAYLDGRCLLDLLSEQVRAQPERTAARSRDGSLTYRELMRLSSGPAPGRPLCVSGQAHGPLCICQADIRVLSRTSCGTKPRKDQRGGPNIRKVYWHVTLRPYGGLLFALAARGPSFRKLTYGGYSDSD